MQSQLDKLNTEIIACRKCPRLVEWREEVARVKRKAYKDKEYWGKPVPGFGDPNARVLVCELPIDHRAPEYPAPISDLQMLVVCSGGKQRSAEDFRRLFAAAKLQLSVVHEPSLPMTVFEGRRV